MTFWLPPLLIFLLGLLWFRMPHFTRPDIFFAVTVQPGFRYTPQAMGILRKYTVQILIHTVIALSLAAAFLFTQNQKLYGLAIGWQLVGPIYALTLANRRTKPFAAEPSREYEVDLSPYAEALPGGMVGVAIPFVILAASAVILYVHWAQIPQRFPVHWGLDGTPNRWMDRTPRNVYGFLLLGAFTCLSMVVSGALIARTRRISVTGEAGHNERKFRRLNLWTLLAAEYAIAICWGGLPILATLRSTSAGPLFGGLTLVLSAGAIALMMRQGQGGSRLSPVSLSPNAVGDRTPDSCWKWGLLYINKNDSALFVEKRFGLGYTLNLGNPWSWVLGSTMLVVPLGALFLR